MKGEFRVSGPTAQDKATRHEARRKANAERMERLRAGRGGAIVERVEIEGEEMFIKRLSWPEIARVKLALPRDAKKVLDLRTSDSVLALSAALAVSCVVMKPEGWGEDGFDLSSLKPEALELQYEADEALELVNEVGEAAMRFNMQLFDHCTRINPDVLPSSQAS